jgi:preprotein translocase subunit SecG
MTALRPEAGREPGAGTNMSMTILYYAILVVHVIACLFLIGVVLLQQGKGQDLASAFGGGGTQTAFGPRGSANVLSRATTILAGLFMVTSLALSLVKPRQGSILDKVATPAASPSPAVAGSSPAVPGSPAASAATAATPAVPDSPSPTPK